MNIYIPTYGRPAKQITFKSLTPAMQHKTFFVCRSEEENKLRAMWSPYGCDVLVCDTPGVAAARQAALEHSIYDKVCFFDDDLRFSKRLADWDVKTNPKLIKATPQEISSGIMWMQKRLNEFAMVGLGARGGNNGIGHRWENPNYRIMRSFAVNKATMEDNDIRFDDFYYWEDFHVALSLLEIGFENRVNVDIVSDGVTDTQGGVQRNFDHMHQLAKEFDELHPNAKLKMKKFKHGINQEATVPDFTIQWKKAVGAKL